MTVQQAIAEERQRYVDWIDSAIDARKSGDTAGHARRVLHARIHFLAWQRLRHAVITSADLDASLPCGV